MEKNFKVGQSNELIQGGESFDLHNCYDFSKLHLEGNQAFLGFEPNPEHGKNLSPVLVKFDGLIYFAVSPDFCSTAQVDLDEIGYKSPDDFDDEWLLREEQAEENDHIFFRFIGGQSVRVLASKAELVRARMCSEIRKVPSEATP